MAAMTLTSGDSTFVESSRPAHADLHHGEIHAPLGVMQAGHGGQKLEGGAFHALFRQLLRRRAHAACHGNQVVVRNRNTVHADALVKAAQIGRREQPRAEAAGAQPRVNQGAGGALAVGARHVNHAPHAHFGMPERLKQRPGVFKSVFFALPARAVYPVDRGLGGQKFDHADEDSLQLQCGQADLFAHLEHRAVGDGGGALAAADHHAFQIRLVGADAVVFVLNRLQHGNHAVGYRVLERAVAPAVVFGGDVVHGRGRSARP